MNHKYKQCWPGDYRQTPDSPPPPPNPHWYHWMRLYQIAPGLRDLHEVWGKQKRPPRPLHDATFVALAACFSDPTKREVLRALILDALGDDLVELIQLAMASRKD